MEENYDTDLNWREILAEGETKIYIGAYLGLVVLAFVQLGLEMSGIAYGLMFAGIMVVSTAKTLVVVAYFQHLKWEPRILTYVYVLSLAAVLLLMLAAAYSIT
ncbi:MAG: cytochrome C oxidase subunit IV family protein [Halobacteriales archaeon]